MTDRGTQFAPNGDDASGWVNRVYFVEAIELNLNHTDFGSIAFEPEFGTTGSAITVIRPRNIFVWNGSTWILPQA